MNNATAVFIALDCHFAPLTNADVVVILNCVCQGFATTSSLEKNLHKLLYSFKVFSHPRFVNSLLQLEVLFEQDILLYSTIIFFEAVCTS